MSLPPFADVAAVEKRLRRELDSDEAAQCEEFLDDASDLIRHASGSDWVDDTGALDGTDAQLSALGRVCAAAAARVMRNPGGANQQTAGPFSQSFSPSNSTPSVYLTKSERGIVARAAGKVGLGVLGTTRGDIETALITSAAEDDDWVVVQ